MGHESVTTTMIYDKRDDRAAKVACRVFGAWFRRKPAAPTEDGSLASIFADAVTVDPPPADPVDALWRTARGVRKPKATAPDPEDDDGSPRST